MILKFWCIHTHDPQSAAVLILMIRSTLCTHTQLRVLMNTHNTPPEPSHQSRPQPPVQLWYSRTRTRRAPKVRKHSSAIPHSHPRRSDGPQAGNPSQVPEVPKTYPRLSDHGPLPVIRGCMHACESANLPCSAQHSSSMHAGSAHRLSMGPPHGTSCKDEACSPVRM